LRGGLWRLTDIADDHGGEIHVTRWLVSIG
jgi:hypothetical protein